MFFEFGLSVVGIPRIHVVGISVFVGSRPHGLDVKFFILKLKIPNLNSGPCNLDLTTTDVPIAECRVADHGQSEFVLLCLRHS